MPGSAISVSNSSASSASKRAKARQYRTVSHHSQIDESLFGEPNRVTKRNEMLHDMWMGDTRGDLRLETLAKQRKDKRKNGKNSNRETVQVITKDLIRNLIVPTEDPSGQTMVLPRYDFERILRAARTFTKDEKEAHQEAIKKEKEAALEAAYERKNFMKAMDLTRQQNEKLNDLEEEAKEKSEHLLAKANEMRQEQEDEIKHLNELILNAKCHAIRDAQILEKGQIRGEMTDEEKRLDLMMEVDRQNTIRIQEEIEKKRKEEQFLGAAKLMEQIQDNEQERLFELERKDQENLQMQKYIGKLMDEDQDQKIKKKTEQTILREELNKANNDIIRRRGVKQQQEMAEEHKVLEYQKQKAEREAAFEADQEKIRIEKEREVARLRALQERARDEQADRDALRAKRAQEQTEREWRKKEAEEAWKKTEMEAMLKDARSMQMSQKEHYLAVQAQRERVEFERVLRAQKDLVEKDRREEHDSRKKRLTHAEEVRRQIRQKEQLKMKERNAFFEEGIRLDEEARSRRNRLEEVKRKKLTELRDIGIPDKYLHHVIHQAKLENPESVSA